ncbi:hypothetical protein KXD40_005589 [Peronospora effusa]|uniref:Uncharacterized protein n=1 Tax=Peronospora effusa TaxID=542832 RepID=A0A3M6VQJ8_9STRA|nr:hypothetical protein DD238_004735 [Peronospora effusa]RQM14780.1 hypothetical protein DD237_007260 [Peronospora effusa]UIZ27660.1 hypothetical protein KXD40_005589 [Peronospora effusa]CAI5727402.1 unnamed protein product [Peronospora effusa]
MTDPLLSGLLLMEAGPGFRGHVRAASGKIKSLRSVDTFLPPPCTTYKKREKNVMLVTTKKNSWTSIMCHEKIIGAMGEELMGIDKVVKFSKEKSPKVSMMAYKGIFVVRPTVDIGDPITDSAPLHRDTDKHIHNI